MMIPVLGYKMYQNPLLNHFVFHQDYLNITDSLFSEPYYPKKKASKSASFFKIFCSTTPNSTAKSTEAAAKTAVFA